MKGATFFLFLNKIDVLVDMVKLVSFKQFWPEYEGKLVSCHLDGVNVYVGVKIQETMQT
jgi:hypothetical protein